MNMVLFPFDAPSFILTFILIARPKLTFAPCETYEVHARQKLSVEKHCWAQEMRELKKKLKNWQCSLLIELKDYRIKPQVCLV